MKRKNAMLLPMVIAISTMIYIMLILDVYFEFVIGQWVLTGAYMGIWFGTQWATGKYMKKTVSNVICFTEGSKIYYIKRQERSGKREGFKYTISGLQGVQAYTNFYRDIKKAEWIVMHDNYCKLEQTNNLVRWINYIPGINLIVNLIQCRQYSIIFNDECVGDVNQVWVGTNRKVKFTVYGKDYFIGIGNSKVLAPWKSYYEWPIEASDERILAIVRTDGAVGDYIVEVKNMDLDITIIILMVMITDVYRFSGELRERTIYG